MKKLIYAFIFLAGSLTANAQTVAPFKAGDRVAFVGNSITDGGHYHSYIWYYYMVHFPNMRITCYNVGIGGDAIGQIADRFDVDALGKKPTVLTLTWGMNDSGYFEWYKPDAATTMNARIEKSFRIYDTLANKLKARTDIRKIIILGSPYDEKSKFTKNNIYPGKTKAFTGIIDFQQQAAKKTGWGIVDFFHPMTAINDREQLKDSTFSLTPNDRIHPDNNGHMVMAYLFLKTQGLANHKVADIVVNAQTKKAERMGNCTITNMSGNANALSFNYLAKSLPYAADTVPRGWGNRKSQAQALKLVPFTDEFNQELLTVKGLQSGIYSITIDGENIGQWQADDLAKGINLAEINTTPQYLQSVQVRELNEERWDIERRGRMYMWMEYDFLKGKHLLFKDNNAAMDSIKKEAPKNPFVNGNMDMYSRARFKSLRDAWQKEQNVLIDEIYAINKPVNRKITITRLN